MRNTSRPLSARNPRFPIVTTPHGSAPETGRVYGPANMSDYCGKGQTRKSSTHARGGRASRRDQPPICGLRIYRELNPPGQPARFDFGSVDRKIETVARE